jgi:RND family efflux transporter MFP subunit
MNRRTLLMAGAVGLVLVAGILYFILGRKSGGAEEGDVTPTAAVTVAPVRSTRLDDITSAYGLVSADPAGVLTVAAPRALIVTRILVRAGEAVGAGQAVIEIANAPAADMAYRQAVDAVTIAKADLERTQRLFDERLAANDQLNAARKALADAEAAVASQEKQGAGRAVQTLLAGAAGVVTTISVSPGDHVAQDAPLVAVAAAKGLVAKLGLEPGGAVIQAGDAVSMQPVNAAGGTISGRVSMVGHAADQTTKTYDAIVPLNGASLPVGAAVQARVTTGSHQGLLVPRGAVVFDETGTHLFVVSGGKAHRVFVKTGRTYGEDIEISGPVQAGQAVAVQGADELEDGMAVKAGGK